ncbi:MAG: c-type cytochrome, partial [Pseudoalteromonas spongiae]
MNKLSILGAMLASIASLPSQAKVEELFKSTCASCHGETLMGAMAPSLVDNTWLTDGTDKALTNAIKNGIANVGMPAFGETLSDEQV